jgi:hypothetical protein
MMKKVAVSKLYKKEALCELSTLGSLNIPNLVNPPLVNGTLPEKALSSSHT